MSIEQLDSKCIDRVVSGIARQITISLSFVSSVIFFSIISGTAAKYFMNEISMFLYPNFVYVAYVAGAFVGIQVMAALLRYNGLVNK